MATVKFDSRNKVPYSALLQALSQILQQIMTEPQEEMRRFHHYLRACLGARFSNIGILADFVPELGALLERPDSAKGGVSSKKAIATIQTDNIEAQNRFLNMYVEIFRSITFWRMITLVWYRKYGVHSRSMLLMIRCHVDSFSMIFIKQVNMNGFEKKDIDS